MILHFLINILTLPFSCIVDVIRSLDNLIVKSDEQVIDLLLENDEDKVKFQRAITELETTNNKSVIIRLKGKDYNISIQ